MLPLLSCVSVSDFPFPPTIMPLSSTTTMSLEQTEAQWEKKKLSKRMRWEISHCFPMIMIFILLSFLCVYTREFFSTFFYFQYGGDVKAQKNISEVIIQFLPSSSSNSFSLSRSVQEEKVKSLISLSNSRVIHLKENELCSRAVIRRRNYKKGK
jgi:hypothetical protein